MSEAVIVDKLEQLKPFLNDSKCLEIVQRGKHKRIAAIQKVFLNELPQAQEKEALEQVVHALNKNTLLNERNLKLLGEVAKSQKIGLLLNGLNLCATCVGFAIMYKKLDKMSEEIGQQINQLKNIVKQGQDVQTDYEFGKVLADHTDMLDCRRKQQPYSEEKMRDLVDREYNILSLLINVFMRDISADNKSTIFSIFSMLSMFTVSLRFFDEIYFENNHKALKDSGVWHTSHDKWTSVYSMLLSPQFVQKLQDYAVFETSLNTLGIDVYYMGLLDQVVEQQEEIADNQELIVMLEDVALLHSLREITGEEIKGTISDAFAEICGDAPSAELQKILGDAVGQMALA